jgi:hypothetical protein
MLKSLKDPNNPPISKEEAYQIIHNYLDAEIRLAHRKQLDEVRFDSASWAEFQAFQLGMLKMLDKLKQFIPDQGL